MGNLRMNADQISYKGGEKPMSVEEAIKNAGNTGLAHTADIAPDFSAESAYNAGDLVYHNGTLYVFTSNHAAGAWSTDDTQAVTVGGEITSLMSGLTDVTRGLIRCYPIVSKNNYVALSLPKGNTYTIYGSVGVLGVDGVVIPDCREGGTDGFVVPYASTTDGYYIIALIGTYADTYVGNALNLVMQVS